MAARARPTSQEKITEAFLALNILDYSSAALLAFALPDLVDTVQFANKCNEAQTVEAQLYTPTCRSPVEVWDVRSLRLVNVRETIPRKGIFERARHAVHNLSTITWGRLGHGPACELSTDWHSCMACKGSIMEQTCALKCTKNKPGSPSHYAPDQEGSPTYGGGVQPIYRDFFTELERRRTPSPMAKVLVFEHHWAETLRLFAETFSNSWSGLTLGTQAKIE